MQNPILMLFLSFKAGPVSAVGSPSSRLAQEFAGSTPGSAHSVTSCPLLLKGEH